MKKLLLLLCLLVPLLGGCALGQAVFESAKDNQLAFRYALMRVIDGDPVRANEVLRVAQAVKESSRFWDTVSVAQLIEEAEAHIPWQRMHPADQMLVRAFLPDLAEALAATVAEGQLKLDTVYRLEPVFSWIEETAYLSGASL